MKSLLKIELRRAFFNNTWFLSAVLLGLIITGSQLLQTVVPVACNLDKYMNRPGYLFSRWIGGALMGVQPFLYYLLLPVIAVLPYAGSFFEDKKDGYLKNILIRAEKKNYLAAKYLAVFLSGGTAVVIPLLANFAVTALLLPAIRPQPTTALYAIGAASLWCDLFYTHPFVYVFLYLMIDFIFGGFIAAVALAVSYSAEHWFTVLFFPFLFYLFLFMLFSFLGLDSFSPVNFLQASFGKNDIRIISIETAALGLTTAAAFFGQGLSDDVY